MEGLVYLPATEVLRLFRSRRLSPVELMTAVIERAEAVEPRVNAFAERLYEDALEQARVAEACYAGRGTPARALEGLPVAVKEEQPIAGHTLAEGRFPLTLPAAVPCWLCRRGRRVMGCRRFSDPSWRPPL